MGKNIVQTFVLLAGVLAGVAAADTAANRDLIGRFASQVFEEKNLDGLGEYMHEDYIQHNPLVDQGIAGFQAFFSSWFEAVPDFNYTLKNMAAEGDYVWVYGSYSGTQQKAWLGLPGSGRRYDFDGVDIFRIEDGRLAEHWDVLDIHTLFDQLGADD